MNNDAILIKNINIKNIKFGHSQNFNNDYTPIYYNKKELIIKTPRVFISNSILKYNNSNTTRYFINIYLKDIHNEDKINEFVKFIGKIERKIKKKFKQSNKTFISLLQKFNNSLQIRLSINLKLSECYDIKNNRLVDWNYTYPTYGYFIIFFKNIWETKSKFGINLYTYGGLILPSQIKDPEPLPNIKYYFLDELNKLKTIEDDSQYKPFFKMKKMLIPIQAIKQKIILNNLNPNVIDYDGNTLINNIPELNIIKKKITNNKITVDLLKNVNLKNNISKIKIKKYETKTNKVPTLSEIINGKNNLKPIRK